MAKEKKGDDLLAAAQLALDHAHAPYSGYKAGAALRLNDKRIFAGCTVENPAYAQGCDAIETAAGIMIASGWANAGVLPRIDEAVICYEKEEERFGWLPGQGGRAMLEIFGVPETRISFAVRGKGAVKTGPLKDLLLPAPVHFLGRDKYPAAVRQRLHKESHPVAEAFAADPLKKLYGTRLEAFCPVSHYAVGSMIETQEGLFFYGCNVETGTNTCLHAENNAIAAMVAALGPAARIRRVHVLTAGNRGFPCGDCRQRIHEFALSDTEVVAMNLGGEQETVRFRTLFPHSFGRADLDSAEEAA